MILTYVFPPATITILLGGQWQRVFGVWVANQSAPSTLITVLEYTNYWYPFIRQSHQLKLITYHLYNCFFAVYASLLCYSLSLSRLNSKPPEGFGFFLKENYASEWTHILNPRECRLCPPQKKNVTLWLCAVWQSKYKPNLSKTVLKQAKISVTTAFI